MLYSNNMHYSQELPHIKINIVNMPHAGNVARLLAIAQVKHHRNAHVMDGK